jgi:hypothetical protein
LIARTFDLPQDAALLLFFSTEETSQRHAMESVPEYPQMLCHLERNAAIGEANCRMESKDSDTVT